MLLIYWFSEIGVMHFGNMFIYSTRIWDVTFFFFTRATHIISNPRHAETTCLKKNPQLFTRNSLPPEHQTIKQNTKRGAGETRLISKIVTKHSYWSAPARPNHRAPMPETDLPYCIYTAMSSNRHNWSPVSLSSCTIPTQDLLWLRSSNRPGRKCKRKKKPPIHYQTTAGRRRGEVVFKSAISVRLHTPNDVKKRKDHSCWITLHQSCTPTRGRPSDNSCV